MCALSAQHAQNGAVFTTMISRTEFAALATQYLHEATSIIPAGFDDYDVVNLARSYGLLALLGSQIGDTNLVQKHLGLYHGLCARYSMHDEHRWPADEDECTIEVRRRIFWAVYKLEAHTACVMGHMIRSPEAQTDVSYPQGMHHPAFVHGRDGQFEDWFTGWNYTTDLYRILEHAMIMFRSSRRGHRSILKDVPIESPSLIASTLAAVEERLLPQFCSAFSPSNDSGRNRSGFQATNILSTLNLVKMVTSILQGDDIDAACQTAHDLVDSIRKVPPQYIRATGNPLIQQLAGAGYLLHGLAEKVISSDINSEKLMHALHAIKSVLEELSCHHTAAADAAIRLDGYLHELRTRTATRVARDLPFQSGHTLNLDLIPQPMSPNLGTFDFEWPKFFPETSFFAWQASASFNASLPE
jgi:hypothetical protein